MTTMLFPDPRFRSSSALGAFGLTIACDDVRATLNELEALLAQAQAAKLLVTHWFSADEGHPVAVAAQTLYKQVLNQNLVILSDSACAETSAQLREAASQLRSLLEYHQIEKPEYEAPELTTVPGWLKVGGGLLLATVSVVAVAYIFGQGTTVAKLFKSSRRLSRYRRRR